MPVAVGSLFGKGASLIGTFDTIHFGTYCCQTKALGRGLAELGLGDHGQVIPAPLDAEQNARSIEYGDEPIAASGNVLTSAGWLVLVDGVLTGWSRFVREGLACFGYLGQPLSDQQGLRIRFTTDETADARQTAIACDYCAAARDGRFDEFRAERRAELRRSRLRPI